MPLFSYREIVTYRRRDILWSGMYIGSFCKTDGSWFGAVEMQNGMVFFVPEEELRSATISPQLVSLQNSPLLPLPPTA